MGTNSRPTQEDAPAPNPGDVSRYVLGHKLSNLLTPVVGMSYILSTRAASCGDADAERLARTIHDAAQAASRLLSLFILTRDIETRTRTPLRRPGDLDHLLRGVLHELEPTAAANGARGELTAEAPCRIMMDYELLPAAFRYLIEGALHGRAAESESSQRPVRIHLEYDGSEALVGIRYDSASIEPRLLEHFFDPMGTPANGKGGRTGLEYAYARAVVEAHGGRLSVAISEPGIVTMTVVLPGGEGRES
jgi:light-regulated signal transduction histidine kinase (bacteriophytochrome)